MYKKKIKKNVSSKSAIIGGNSESGRVEKKIQKNVTTSANRRRVVDISDVVACDRVGLPL